MKNLNRTYHERPYARPLEDFAAKKLLTELIPKYREVVPLEVQEYLEVDLDSLEERCKNYVSYEIFYITYCFR